MPRPVVPGQPLHLIQRGNNRAECFVDDEDRTYYLRTLREASRRMRCAIHAYVLMTNHVHLLLTPEDEAGPARMMQGIGRRYVRYFNERHDRTGTLWEGRFRSTLIDSERYLFACSRYIELNPVRAGIVNDPAAYRWSSFRCNGGDAADPLITPHPAYRGLGGSRRERRSAYLGLFDAPLEPGVTEAIRRAARTGGVLGTARYLTQLETALNRRLTRQAHGGSRRRRAGAPNDAVTQPRHASSFFNDSDPLK